MKRKVYDKVWVMINNKPKEMLIFAVTESMDHFKTGSDLHYNIVVDTFGVGWGNNEGIQLSEDIIFDTKQELLESL